MRELTMGCWWSSRAYPKPEPRWDMIKLELLGTADSARFYGFADEAAEAQRLADLIP